MITGRPLVDNAADKQQVRDAKKELKERRAQECDDLRTVLSSHAGRRVIYRYLAMTNVLGNPFTESERTTTYLLGLRSVGVKMIKDLKEASPDLFLRLLTEQTLAEEVRSENAANTVTYEE